MSVCLSTAVMWSVQQPRVYDLPVTRADTEAAALGEISQVPLRLSHVLVDLLHAILHTTQLLWNTTTGMGR